MQEKRITDDLENRAACIVPPVKNVIPEIKPCNRSIIYCPRSTALACNHYKLQLVRERQKYRGNED
jgi:hypothetical protein